MAPPSSSPTSSASRYQQQPREELLACALQLHLNRTMAELFGKEEGYCRGRGGGMHIADFHVGHLGANAIVGGSFAIAAGAAMAAEKLGNGRVVPVFVGDGATNNGISHEACNFAAMDQFEHGCPVIFLIENNQYGMTGQQQGEVTGIDYLAQRGVGYTMRQHARRGRQRHGRARGARRRHPRRRAVPHGQGPGAARVPDLSLPRATPSATSASRTAPRKRKPPGAACDAIDTYDRQGPWTPS